MNSGPLSGPWDTLIYQEEFKPRPGVPLSAALRRLALWEGEERARSVAINYLKSGIWTATCQRAFQREGILKTSEIGGESGRFLQILERTWGPSHHHQAYDLSYLSKQFWLNDHASAGEDWTWETGFLWPDGARVAMDRGIVEAFQGFFLESDDDSEFMGTHITAFGVEVSEFDVDATAPEGSAGDSTRQQQERATKYDWEAAFADVAADLYHEADFPKLDARGTQAEIIKMLRQSFERRRLKVPSEDTLKPKARMILGALRAKKPE